MLFTKEFLKDRAGSNCAYKEIVRHSRWSVHYREVFEHEGKYYETTYSVGATESQDERPYEYDGDPIECPEVKPVAKTIIVYEKV
jgi:hypothetical protein